MISIGLTGGIGAGKSFISEFLKEHSIPVIDTDVISRQLLEPEQPAWTAVKLKFGDSYFYDDGRLDRSRLAECIFTDPSSKKKLDALIHPMIRAHWMSEIARLRHKNEQVCIVVIPLLFETNVQDQFEFTISMACSSGTQMKRLELRGWGRDHIKSRIAAQWTMEKKADFSQYVIWTDCPRKVTVAQVRLIFKSFGTNI